MCQILINLVDTLEKIFINIFNSVCVHHESVIFVIYDPKNIYIDIFSGGIQGVRTGSSEPVLGVS